MTDHTRQTLFIALLTGAILVTWILVTRLLVPPFLEHAYRGTGPSILSDLLPRRKTLPLEHYLVRAERISLTVSVLVALGGLGLVATTRPAVQRHLQRTLHSSRPVPLASGSHAPLSRRRRLVATAVIGALIGGHLFDIVTGTEHWPFSHYGMFSGLASRNHLSARLYVYGVSRAGDVPIDVAGYLSPFDDQRFRGAMNKLRRRPDAQIAIEKALRYAGDRYERLRTIGAHQGPPLLAVRLVEVSWKQADWAQNKDSPDSHSVLYEVRLRRDKE